MHCFNLFSKCFQNIWFRHELFWKSLLVPKSKKSLSGHWPKIFAIQLKNSLFPDDSRTTPGRLPSAAQCTDFVPTSFVRQKICCFLSSFYCLTKNNIIFFFFIYICCFLASFFVVNDWRKSWWTIGVKVGDRISQHTSLIFWMIGQSEITATKSWHCQFNQFKNYSCHQPIHVNVLFLKSG